MLYFPTASWQTPYPAGKQGRTVLTPGIASVEVKVLEMTDQLVTVTPVAKAFQLKNRLPRSCMSVLTKSFDSPSSSIEEEMSNGNWRELRAMPVLGAAVGITLLN